MASDSGGGGQRQWQRRNQIEYSPMELLSMDLSEIYVASGLEVGNRID